MKKKYALVAAAVALLGTLAVGGTLAWFTDTETATNVVTTGNVDIAWYENGRAEENKITEKHPGVNYGEDVPVTPGQDLVKTAMVHNEGKNAAYIRASIEFWDTTNNVAISAPELKDLVDIIGTDSKWELDSDGYYYYKPVVPVDGWTDPIMAHVKIKGTEANNYNFQDKTFEIRLLAEAVQSDNRETGVDTCKKAFGNVKILDYEHPEVEAQLEEVQ